jgi:SAM-dependent methyltransferase
MDRRARPDPRWRPRLELPPALRRRYGLTDASDALVWQTLYHREPDLYDRLVEGEPLHPRLFRSLPLAGALVLEVGAGTGRLTLPAATRARHLYALEPVAAMRAVLERTVAARGMGNITVLEGRADAVPLADGTLDLTISASAFGSDPEHGGEAGLYELRRVTRKGGEIIVLWPDDPGWFVDRGFTYLAFDDDLEVRFRDLAAAIACAELFYSSAVVRYFRRTGRPVIPFTLLGVNPARDLCRLSVE